MTTPPPIIQPPPLPVKGPSLLAVATFSGGAVLLFILNLLLPLVTIVKAHRHVTLIHYLIGYVMGNFFIPFVAITCVCMIWKSNRRPYRLLACLFWVLLGLFLLKVGDLITAVPAVHWMGGQ